MFDFGDEFVIDSYGIPWLIWIQLIVMFLLIILLYFFSSTSLLDLSPDSAAAPSLSTAGNLCRTNDAPPLSGVTGSSSDSKVGENESNKETGTSTSRSRKEDIQDMEDFSTMDRAHDAFFGRPHNPCNFLGLATQAFLKCLGLDSSSENSSTRKHSKKHS